MLLQLHLVRNSLLSFTARSQCISRIEGALKEIHNLAQGGTAVGTVNTRKNFDKQIIRENIKNYKISFKPVKNKFAALAAHDAIVNFSSTMNTTAVCLMKIANDIRFLDRDLEAVMVN